MATKANLLLDQGSTFSTTITLTDENGDPLDLTGYSGRAQIRKHSSSNTAYDFTVDLANTTGEVTLSMSANGTAAIPGGRYLYDVELIDHSNNVVRILEGIISVDPEITK